MARLLLSLVVASAIAVMAVKMMGRQGAEVDLALDEDPNSDAPMAERLINERRRRKPEHQVVNHRRTMDYAKKKTVEAHKKRMERLDSQVNGALREAGSRPGGPSGL